RKVREAAAWPATRAIITKSSLEKAHRNDPQNALAVVHKPVVVYEFTIGPRKFHGTRVSLGSDTPNDETARATLPRYTVGATFPVYYDPENPDRSFLERDPPLRPAWMYTIAIGIFLAGAAAAVFLTNSDKLVRRLRAALPPGAHPVGMIA